MTEHDDRPALSAPATGSPDPAWMNAACYCSDARSEHARNAGPCLMVRDGVRCGCQKFERPDEGAAAGWEGFRPSFDLVPPSTDPGPPWSWPESPEEQTQRLRRSRYGSADREEAETTRDAEPLADPVVRHLQLMRSLADVHDRLVELGTRVETCSAQAEEDAGAIVVELRDGLGTDLTDSDGHRMPGALEDILGALYRVEANTAGDLGLFILRTLVVVGGIGILVAFLWLLAGVTGLAGVMLP